jgi:DNA phosphorothioation-associated putative methyltransferase
VISFEEYKEAVKALPIGKKVGTNTYILWPDLGMCSPLLRELISAIKSDVDDTTLIKFFLDQFKISFLSYPDFFTDPHPRLRHSLSINLATGKQRAITYEGHSNVPILHRKETMVSSRRSEYAMWESLTKELEALGLYQQTKKIGYSNYWDELLQAKGISYDGHKLIKASVTHVVRESDTEVFRHKTAISRGDFSRPVQFLLKHQFISDKSSFFDYGCGLGDDIRALRFNGYTATGWDPVHAPDQAKIKSEVVNLGFVLNVIEDHSERIDVLIDAFQYSSLLLCVSVVTDISPTATNIRPYGDGFLTSRGTFQKFYKHDEAQAFIEETLNRSAHSIAPGIFYIFQHEQDAQDFLASKQKSKVNWSQLNLHIFPSKDQRDSVKKAALYDKHKTRLEAYWEQILNLGRVPSPEEYPEGKILQEELKLTPAKLQTWFIERYGKEALESVYKKRKDDLLVYLGLANFKRKIPFTHLSIRLQKDIKTFFSSYSSGQQEAIQQLFHIGNASEIESRCHKIHNESGIGVLDEQALYISSTDLQELDPVLRMYVGVAGLLYGDISEVDEIKIHKQSGKVTFLQYDSEKDREDKKVHYRIKVDLRNQKVFFFDHKR